MRKDGTVSYLGRRFEVPYELSGKTVKLVVDPHAERVVGVEDETGKSLGAATELDQIANQTRVRRKPGPEVVVMESTGIYGKSPYAALDHGRDHDKKED